MMRRRWRGGRVTEGGDTGHFPVMHTVEVEYRPVLGASAHSVASSPLNFLTLFKTLNITNETEGKLTRS